VLARKCVRVRVRVRLKVGKLPADGCVRRLSRLAGRTALKSTLGATATTTTPGSQLTRISRRLDAHLIFSSRDMPISCRLRYLSLCLSPFPYLRLFFSALSASLFLSARKFFTDFAAFRQTDYVTYEYKSRRAMATLAGAACMRALQPMARLLSSKYSHRRVCERMPLKSTSLCVKESTQYPLKSFDRFLGTFCLPSTCSLGIRLSLWNPSRITGTAVLVERRLLPAALCPTWHHAPRGSARITCAGRQAF